MLRGKVKRVNPERGFGIISGNGREVFFDFSSVEDDGFNRLRVGQRVEYELSERGAKRAFAAERKHKKNSPLQAAYVRPAQ
jgi:cold shock CspA family protein